MKSKHLPIVRKSFNNKIRTNITRNHTEITSNFKMTNKRQDLSPFCEDSDFQLQ